MVPSTAGMFVMKANKVGEITFRMSSNAFRPVPTRLEPDADVEAASDPVAFENVA